MRRLALCLIVVQALAGVAHAGDADVIGVAVHARSAGTYDFDVTIRSADTGWDRYADLIEAVGPDGTVLGTRALEHPHDDEQPFTRDLYQVKVPSGTRQVIIRARFKPSGYNGKTATITLPDR